MRMPAYLIVVAGLAHIGCAPRPGKVPPARPSASAHHEATLQADIRASQAHPPSVPLYVIGELCTLPQEHMFPRFLVRNRTWSTDGDAAQKLLTRNAAFFSVIGHNGEANGTFITMPETIALDPAGFTGTYIDYRAGGVCSFLRNGRSVANAGCYAADGCSLAVALIDDTDVSWPANEFAVAQTCVDRGMLVADINGDGANESFELAAFLDNYGAAPAVWGAEPSEEQCGGVRGFAWYQRMLPGRPAIDVLGIVDLDSDGFLELYIAIRTEASRTIAVYQADAGGLRLERVAVTVDSRTF